jgi:hypothetical protein
MSFNIEKCSLKKSLTYNMKEYNGGKNELVISIFIKIHFLIVPKKKNHFLMNQAKLFPLLHLNQACC